MNRSDEIVRRFAEQAGAVTVTDMLQRQLNCVPTSSMGRWFDAAAGLLGVNEVQGYEGQAAMMLEGMADRHGKVIPLAMGYIHTAQNDLDFRPLLAKLADCKDVAYGAALFHATLAEGLCAWVQRATGRTGINYVALGGGCFLNNILTQALNDSLTVHGLTVLTAQQLPPNDGAISFGQASVALQHLNQGA